MTIVKFGTHSMRYADSLEDQTGVRNELGLIPCTYCGDVACNFDCDESQANGYPDD